jgi:D-alanyl-D-alanine carboxypeptidase
MMRYEGVDGIKTGYIRASGYNLVTSATRDNHHIIGVVLGGSTFRARDDKMIALMDKSFADLSALPGNRVQYASSGRVIPFPDKVGRAEEKMEGEGDQQDVVSNDEFKAAAQTDGEDSAKSPVTASREQKEPPQQNASLSGGDTGWGIQVGAFERVRDAETAANHAIEQAPGELTGSTVSVSDDQVMHRARLVNLTQEQAEGACQKLAAQHQACFIYRVD